MPTPKELLAAYAALIRDWAPRLDLVSPGDLDRLEERHIEDSLRVVPLLDQLPDGPCADIGSGAGFPGVPLAVARPGRHWTLIEPRRRRGAFLEEVVRELGLDARVVTKPAEACAGDPTLAERHVLATARAVAGMADVWPLAEPLLAQEALALVFEGEEPRTRPPGAKEWAPGLTIMRKT